NSANLLTNSTTDLNQPSGTLLIINGNLVTNVCHESTSQGRKLRGVSGETIKEGNSV
ncbi:MAG: hypothetical protein ACI93T_003288, partial [Porticoccaceae bacterium]